MDTHICKVYSSYTFLGADVKVGNADLGVVDANRGAQSSSDSVKGVHAQVPNAQVLLLLHDDIVVIMCCASLASVNEEAKI